MSIKKALIYCFTMGFSISVFGGGLYDLDRSTPIQVFEQADDSTTPAVTPIQSVSKTEEPAAKNPEVKEPAATPKVKTSAKGDTLEKSAQAALHDEIDTINRTNVIYRQSVDHRIAGLNSQMQQAQLQLKKLSEAMLLLNQEVFKLSKQNVGVTASDRLMPVASVMPSKPADVSWVKLLQDRLGFYGFYILLGVVILALAVAAWSFLPSSKKRAALEVKANKAVSPIEMEDDTQGEYDYMGSDESMPAKLNLARAYIAMEDYKAAKKVIKEVLSSGDAAQSQQAHDLLEKIAQAKA